MNPMQEKQEDPSTLEKGSVTTNEGQVTVDQLERPSESLRVQQIQFRAMSRKLLDYGVEMRG